MKLKIYYFLFALVVLAFAACRKENSDQTTIKEDIVMPDVTLVNCAALSMEIATALFPDTSNLTATASGGLAPYAYKWSTSARNQVASVTADGTYSVTATDANGCTAVKQIVVDMPSDPCDGFSGLIALENSATGPFLKATTSGGTAPFTYTWSNGSNAPAIAYNPNVSSNYQVTIVDANGCAVVDVFEVAPNPCSSFNVTISRIPPTAVSPTKLEASATGGTVPYAYKWSTGATTSAINATPGNTYTVRVTDAQGCYVDKVINF